MNVLRSYVNKGETVTAANCVRHCVARTDAGSRKRSNETKTARTVMWEANIG